MSTKVRGQVQAALLLLTVHKDGVPVGRPVSRADQMQLRLTTVSVCVDLDQDRLESMPNLDITTKSRS